MKFILILFVCVIAYTAKAQRCTSMDNVILTESESKKSNKIATLGKGVGLVDSLKNGDWHYVRVLSGEAKDKCGFLHSAEIVDCKHNHSTTKPHTTTSHSTHTTTSHSNTSRQCSGTTQKGSRCKKMTTSSNGRCYLHGGN